MVRAKRGIRDKVRLLDASLELTVAEHAQYKLSDRASLHGSPHWTS